MNFSKDLGQNPIFSHVSESAKKLGIESFVVGGFVRDLLLKRESKDIDFVCVGDGLKLAKEVSNRLNGKAKVSFYENFGTASIRFQDYDYEFVGARKESYSRDSPESQNRFWYSGG